MKKALLNFTETLSSRALHETLARDLDFPASYGHNLDALYDCLTESNEPTEIHLSGAIDTPLCHRFLRVITAAAAENPELTVITE